MDFSEGKGVMTPEVSVKQGGVDYSAAVPVVVDWADSMSAEAVARVWKRIYAMVGCETGSESEKLAVRAAAYVYAVKNGTSSESDFEGNVTTSTGRTFEAGVIKKAAGPKALRRFYRGNLGEAYAFLKATQVMQMDERFVAKMAEAGVAAELGFATADFLLHCPAFTPVEQTVHEAYRLYSLGRASRARGGKTVEELRASEQERELAAEAPAVPNPGHAVW